MEKFRLKYESSVNNHGLTFKSVGYTIRIRLVETDLAGKRIIKNFEGTIIRLTRLNSFANASVLIRIAGRIAIEKLFMLNLPVIDKIEIISCKKARRAKLYYIRSKVGKSAKLKTLDTARLVR